MELLNKQPVEFNLWDGLVKPVGWYFGDAGKEAYFSAFENTDEMNRAFDESNWILLTFNVCYQSSKKPIAVKKNWLIKFFYEYIISRYSIRMATNEHTLVLLTAMSAIKRGDSPIFPYPDCLDDEKQPVLYFFSRVKDLLPSGYSETVYPILKDIVNYIYNVFSVHGNDASRESFLYDKSLYVDYRGKPNEYVKLKEKLNACVEFPDCLKY